MNIRRHVPTGLVATAIGAVALTKFFYDHPDLFPAGLRDLGTWLVALSGAQSSESSSNIEIAFVLMCSAVLVGLVVAVIAAAWAWTSRHRPRTPPEE